MSINEGTSSYSRNPDVVLREEDIDGGLLFNPDTNQIKVLNHTGLFIWKLCDGTHDMAAIANAIRESYEDVPEDQVSDQVETYISGLANGGFIGVAEE
ncbi:MAG: PqqD family peptide modification chaperone [Candidatus Aminicenantes bacterium]|nr:PqqD family peptide modification chaperone [Candidatus Aminicenantes bacterium]